MSDSASPAPKPTPTDAAQPAEAKAKPVATKVKPPAPEDKPFAEFIPQLFLPGLAKEIEAYGGPAPDLSFVEAPMPVVAAPCWQVIGVLPGGRRFWLCFTTAEISSAKTFSVAESGSEPSLLESFLIDERKTTLALLVSRVVSRLNSQKWLGPN
ncbi:DUF2996 domain-containing protein [Synechococcus sp. Tobar12-5m-g]|uniref:DUF2996 domain-containing protein n=1 Tax=unclassified Synechococcus TaxID=2626047 RepID=UPI0020CF4D7D|nr:MULTISPECIES: DUF2996 domain-containing protein [unclassified Synechococcus]MCP9772772.1 DUF2996 domain-containing protein [Synechococcus sp. Tobar12-5m-g]MCP9873591.1 DUF2996 domain-containing protein [Synechococcus sp. Cruz CV-v-12]